MSMNQGKTPQDPGKPASGDTATLRAAQKEILLQKAAADPDFRFALLSAPRTLPDPVGEALQSEIERTAVEKLARSEKKFDSAALVDLVITSAANATGTSGGGPGSSGLTREQLDRLVHKAWEDAGFRERLLTNPEAAGKELGIEIPPAEADAFKKEAEKLRAWMVKGRNVPADIYIPGIPVSSGPEL